MWPLVRNENTKRNIFRGKMSASRAAARRRCVPSSIRSAMFISSRPPEGQAPSGAACDECAESKPNMLLPTQLESEAVGRCDDKRGGCDGAFSALQRWLGGRFVCLRRSSLLAGCIGGCLAAGAYLAGASPAPRLADLKVEQHDALILTPAISPARGGADAHPVVLDCLFSETAPGRRLLPAQICVVA